MKKEKQYLSCQSHLNQLHIFLCVESVRQDGIVSEMAMD